MEILNKYAELLLDYCLDLKAGDTLYIKSTTLAEPLVKEVYREALIRGAHVEIDLEIAEQERIFSMHAKDDQITWAPTLQKIAMKNFSAYLHIRAPHHLRQKHKPSDSFQTLRQSALKPLSDQYFERIAKGSLKRTLCQFPTQAAAQEAGMTLEEYEQFVYSACYLFDPQPQERWIELRHRQQKWVDLLDNANTIQFLAPHVDITFSTAGRKWINSDGRNNMPSGEIYTSPVEDSVEGTIHFTHPLLYKGELVENIILEIKQGLITHFSSTSGQKTLERILQIPGARRFGEAAIGTNYNIQTFTRNILFDEKIGGTVHMAIGQSYLQAGGKNNSAIHLDLITDMKKESKILADNKLIYQDGKFI
jgi:aminopeptidase